MPDLVLAFEAAFSYNDRMAVSPPLPAKMDVARALLLRGTVFVHLDPRCEQVGVPAWLSNQPQLVLQIGLDMPVPIPDLRVDETGVFGTLSFGRSPYTCEVPWDSVFAMVGEDGRGMVWPADMPPEIVAEIESDNSGNGKATGSMKANSHTLRSLDSQRGFNSKRGVDSQGGFNSKHAARSGPKDNHARPAGAFPSRTHNENRDPWASPSPRVGETNDVSARPKPLVKSQEAPLFDASSKFERTDEHLLPNAMSRSSASDGARAKKAAARKRPLPNYLRVVK